MNGDKDGTRLVVLAIRRFCGAVDVQRFQIVQVAGHVADRGDVDVVARGVSEVSRSRAMPRHRRDVVTSWCDVMGGPAATPITWVAVSTCFRSIAASHITGGQRLLHPSS